MTIGIYKIWFSETPHKIYVGSSKTCEKRKTQHLRDLKKGKHINGWLQFAFNKHGQDKFVFEVIEKLDEFNRNHLIEREKFHYYTALDSGFTLYNAIIPELSPTNHGRTRFKKGLKPWNTGKKMLEHVKKILSDSHKGKTPWNKGIKTGLTPWNKGVPMSEEARKKCGIQNKGKVAWNKGKTMSEEHCKKLSEAHKGQIPWFKKRGIRPPKNTGRTWFKNKSLLPV